MLQIKLAAKVIKASDPFAKGPEYVILEIASRDLTAEEGMFLETIFPNTNKIIEQALNTEAVISAIRQ
jgi:hypothetical protein